MGQHSPLLVDMCHYSDVSSADTSPNAGQNTNQDISQGSEQPMQWDSDVNDPFVNCSERIEYGMARRRWSSRQCIFAK